MRSKPICGRCDRPVKAKRTTWARYGPRCPQCVLNLAPDGVSDVDPALRAVLARLVRIAAGRPADAAEAVVSVLTPLVTGKPVHTFEPVGTQPGDFDYVWGIRDVVRVTGRRRESVYRAVRRETLRHRRIDGHLRFRPEDVTEWMGGPGATEDSHVGGDSADTAD